jgi:hypothetical protein
VQKFMQTLRASRSRPKGRKEGLRAYREAVFLFAGYVSVACITSSGTLAQQSLQGFENESRFQRALAAVEAIKQRKKLQCVLSISDGALCECLSQNLPVDIYLRSYAAIANLKNEYMQLSALDKTIVDRCVSNNR